MFYKWLDNWDERRARRGEEHKTPAEFRIDAHLAFPDADPSTTLEQFCDLATKAAADPTFFEVPNAADQAFERDGEWLKFRSDILTDIEENNTVLARIADSGSRKHALMIFHHWNAASWNTQIASLFSRLGITVVEMALPYHFKRRRPGSHYADYMLSANLGRTIQSFKQAVSDGRKLIRWLLQNGYERVSVLGMSLGSWVAALIAAHDPAVSKSSLLLTAGSLADMVWTGRATRAIQADLGSHLNLDTLQKAWLPLNLANYPELLIRRGLNLQVVLAKRDKVVLPAISRRFLKTLTDSGRAPQTVEVNCGHYSLGKPPYALVMFAQLNKFLNK